MANDDGDDDGGMLTGWSVGRCALRVVVRYKDRTMWCLSACLRVRWFVCLRVCVYWCRTQQLQHATYACDSDSFRVQQQQQRQHLQLQSVAAG